jgi:hypothetical protein
MKPLILALGLVLGALVAVAPARAQYYCCCPYVPQAPPPVCWYQPNCYGVCGPYCSYYPSFPPFQGMVFPPTYPGCNGNGNGNGMAGFPSHPWARSPRDFFMWEPR